MEDKHSMSLMLAIFKKNLRESFKILIDNHKELLIEDLNINDSNIESRANYINDYFKFYERFNRMISLCFKSTENNYSLFLICFREVIVKVQTEYTQYNLSYLLPFYIDYIIRNDKFDFKSITENLISIFPTLPDKDIFVEIHKNLVNSILIIFIEVQN